MPKKQSGSDEPKPRIEQSKVPAEASALQLLPISPDEFQARWSLSKETFASGLEAASHAGNSPRLVLRAYSLPLDAKRSDFSSVWHDYRIESMENDAFFTLPRPALKISAAIGLVNKEGRFSPLVRGDAVALPALPDPPQVKTVPGAGPAAPRGKELAYDSNTSIMTSGKLGNPQAGSDEARRQLERWEEAWQESAAIEIQAEFVITGKLAPGMKLRLGNEIIEPDSEGSFVWKRELDSFEQVRPLLREALSRPSVPAGPSPQFFKDADPTERLLDFHTALEITGQVNDPEYCEKLPVGLTLNTENKFKFSRMLPEVASTVPGLSLAAIR